VNINSQRIRRLSKESIWIATGQIISMLGALALVKFLTESLQPSEYGMLALGLTITGLANQVVMGGIANGIGRYFLVAAERGDMNNYFRTAKYIMSYATIAVAGLATLAIIILTLIDLVQWIGVAIAALVFSTLSGINTTMNGVQNAARQRATVALHNGADAWLKIGFAAGAILWFEASSAVVIIGYSVAAIVVILSQLFFLFRLLSLYPVKINSPLKQKYWVKKIWSFSWPISFWGVFTWIQQASDKWALEYFHSTDEVAGYVVLYQLAFVPVSLASGLIVSLISPIMYHRAGDAKDGSRVGAVYTSTKYITLFVFLMSLIGAIISLFWHKEIFSILANGQYNTYSYLMPWMVIASGLQACHHVMGVRISSIMKVRSIMWAQIISALVFSIINILGVFFGGVEGLVYGFTIASFLYFLWIMVFSNILNPSSRLI
jgi:O-antigen/teichoic acid export membrane protein